VQRVRLAHAFAQSLAERVDPAVIRSHPLPHDLRCDTDHVRVAHRASLHHRDDLHSRGQLTLTRLNAQDPGIGAFERIEHFARCMREGSRSDLLDQDAVAPRADVLQCGLQTGRDHATRFVGDQRDGFPRGDREARLHRIARSRHQI
jgi:hypothetical protein